MTQVHFFNLRKMFWSVADQLLNHEYVGLNNVHKETSFCMPVSRTNMVVLAF